jgi:hypothetical protein
VACADGRQPANTFEKSLFGIDRPKFGSEVRKRLTVKMFPIGCRAAEMKLTICPVLVFSIRVLTAASTQFQQDGLSMDRQGQTLRDVSITWGTRFGFARFVSRSRRMHEIRVPMSTTSMGLRNFGGIAQQLRHRGRWMRPLRFALTIRRKGVSIHDTY